MFYALVMSVITNHVSLKTRLYPDYPIWFSASLIIALQDKKKYHRKWKRTDDTDARDKFQYLRSKVKRDIMKCFRRYVATVEYNMFIHIKEVWRYVDVSRQ